MSSSFCISSLMILLRSGVNLRHFFFYRRMVRINLEFVYCYIRTDSSHVLMGPSKAIMVLLEELNECEAEVRAEACSNLDFMVWVVGVDANSVKFVFAWMIRLYMLSKGRL